MGKVKKAIAIEKSEHDLPVLKRVFERRYLNSQDKEELLRREIEGHEILFDANRLQIPPVSSHVRPLEYYGLHYSDGDINGIRKAYVTYILNGVQIDSTGSQVRTKRGGLRLWHSEREYYWYSEALCRYNYLNWLKKKDQVNSIKRVEFILKRESTITRLFEKYGDSFPNETLAIWKQRWIDDPSMLKGIEVDNRCKIGNSRHLLITILSLVCGYANTRDMQGYVLRRWGIKDFYNNKHRYGGNDLSTKHPETQAIIQILKSE